VKGWVSEIGLGGIYVKYYQPTNHTQNWMLTSHIGKGLTSYKSNLIKARDVRVFTRLHSTHRLPPLIRRRSYICTSLFWHTMKANWYLKLFKITHKQVFAIEQSKISSPPCDLAFSIEIVGVWCLCESHSKTKIPIYYEFKEQRKDQRMTGHFREIFDRILSDREQTPSRSGRN